MEPSRSLYCWPTPTLYPFSRLTSGRARGTPSLSHLGQDPQENCHPGVPSWPALSRVRCRAQDDQQGEPCPPSTPKELLQAQDLSPPLSSAPRVILWVMAAQGLWSQGQSPQDQCLPRGPAGNATWAWGRLWAGREHHRGEASKAHTSRRADGAEAPGAWCPAHSTISSGARAQSVACLLPAA